jgi:hypothetical protein
VRSYLNSKLKKQKGVECGSSGAMHLPGKCKVLNLIPGTAGKKERKERKRMGKEGRKEGRRKEGGRKEEGRKEEGRKEGAYIHSFCKNIYKL